MPTDLDGKDFNLIHQSTILIFMFYLMIFEKKNYISRCAVGKDLISAKKQKKKLAVSEKKIHFSKIIVRNIWP